MPHQANGRKRSHRVETTIAVLAEALIQSLTNEQTPKDFQGKDVRHPNLLFLRDRASLSTKGGER